MGKNKNFLWFSLVIGIFIGGGVLVLNSIFPEIVFLKELVQGEVLAGAFIAPPTIFMWYRSIQKEKEDYKRENIVKLLELIKYHDGVFYEISERITEENKITLQDAYKIKHNIHNYRHLIDASDDSESEIDVEHMLLTVASVEIPKTNPELEIWEKALALAETELLTLLFDKKGLDSLKDDKIKYFSGINFTEDKIFLVKGESLSLSDRVFYHCEFSFSFIEKISFKNCIFYECTISSPEGYDNDSDAMTQWIKDNLLDGNNKIQNQIETKSGNTYTDVDLNSIAKNDRKHRKVVIDKRENEKIVNDYLVGNAYYEIKVKETKNSEIKERIRKELSHLSTELAILGKKSNNSRISISKNYLLSNDELNNQENALWGGWNSMNHEVVEKANNFKYYIFANKSDDICYVIVFTEQRFKEYLQKKSVDSGKYHFYFYGFTNGSDK